MLTLAALKAAVHYDPATGVFTRRAGAHRGAVEGKVVGSRYKNGYLYISIGGVRYLAHRLAFLYMTGEFPSRLVDHRNRVRTDNRWDNLRPADGAQNLLNSKLRVDNTSGHRGVSFSESHGRWRARGYQDGREVHLGWHDTKEAAISTRVEFAKKHHAEFARLD